MNKIKRALLIMPLICLIIGILCIGSTTLVEAIFVIMCIIVILIIAYLATIGILGD